MDYMMIIKWMIWMKVKIMVIMEDTMMIFYDLINIDIVLLFVIKFLKLDAIFTISI